ncbi:MoaD/ThiS family protein [Streptomyces sp. 4F14]|uniref:MoaD/ThiS family protein n=1 Tax=Streptomyces sp. 4F14 TaxID=3394380 RepID=UPI003A88F020
MDVHFSGLLLRFTDYERTVSVQADTVGDAMEALRLRFPRLGPVLWDGNGDLRQVHRLIVNGEVVSVDAAQPLLDTDRLEFLTAVAGG